MYSLSWKFFNCFSIQFRNKYGIEDFTPLEKPLKKSDYQCKVEKDIPNYNGYGSYEDSLGNCFTITPKAPTSTFIKVYYNDKCVNIF